MTGAFGAAGADVSAGARLPQLFAQAGVGAPDGTDVAGRIEPLATGRAHHGGRLPQRAADGPGARRHHRAAAPTAVLAAIDRDAARFPDRPVLWPLLIGAWKRKEQA